jgi:hypothetical protein
MDILKAFMDVLFPQSLAPVFSAEGKFQRGLRIAGRFARGNVGIQFGRVKTQADIDQLIARLEAKVAAQRKSDC